MKCKLTIVVSDHLAVWKLSLIISEWKEDKSINVEKNGLTHKAQTCTSFCTSPTLHLFTAKIEGHNELLIGRSTCQTHLAG